MRPGPRRQRLLDYFPEDFLLFVDESHVMLPQVRAMYGGDYARKKTLVEYGFRLPSAFDNRPLKFEEFEVKMNQKIFVSATPGDYERQHSARRWRSRSSAPPACWTRLFRCARWKGADRVDLLGEITTRIQRRARSRTTLTDRKWPRT